ncbi:hypothetical protein L218DRAFT_941513 [Marasmius fiardii PR-910]|nr:hypothetical protein L218DRAFT_941513 [Marasmius fiardii PR-910]
MVHICTTVVSVLVALTSFSLSKPVATYVSVTDVLADFDALHNDCIPTLNTAIENLPNSSDEVQGPEVAYSGRLSQKLDDMDGHVNDVPSVNHDEADGIMSALEKTHPETMSPIDSIARKSGTFTGKEAPLRPYIRVALMDLKGKLADDLKSKTPDDIKPRGDKLEADAVQRFDNAINAYN